MNTFALRRLPEDIQILHKPQRRKYTFVTMSAPAAPRPAAPADSSNWGGHEVYAIRNATTNNYLAAHEDGELVCEDSELMHHDIPFLIYSAHHTHGPSRVYFQCYINGLFLAADEEGGLKAVKDAAAPGAVWHIPSAGAERGAHFLESKFGTFLCAAGEELSLQLTHAAGGKWIIGPATAPPPRTH